MGREISNPTLLEFPKLFWADILRHTRLEVCKLILTFSIVGDVCNSIFLHFCMFYAPFNISGTLEARTLKFSYSMHR